MLWLWIELNKVHFLLPGAFSSNTMAFAVIQLGQIV